MDKPQLLDWIKTSAIESARTLQEGQPKRSGELCYSFACITTQLLKLTGLEVEDQRQYVVMTQMRLRGDEFDVVSMMLATKAEEGEDTLHWNGIPVSVIHDDLVSVLSN